MKRLQNAKIAVALAATTAIVSGCATPTPYQPLGAHDSRAKGGYSDQKITDNIWRVSFVGNTLTSRKTVETYLLYRAAELTLQQGYDSFTIVNRATDRDVETRISRDPAFAGPYGWWRPSWSYFGGFGWRTWDPWYGGPFWADNIDVSTVSKYEATAEIQMSRGTNPNDKASFDARQVVANLGPSIQLPKQ
ncbi:CC0125/CC1285 family lipoprotein [Sphingomonas sp. 3-13AW]|uniref:CC0125/CC1285 family lipoprotein n=1 Tax=Sphingomonas sp. 3-13AW TaxID=3050450 RepID=UPI003BB4BA73